MSNEEVKATVAKLPPFTDDARDRLRHTVAACHDVPDDLWAVLVTSYRDDDGIHRCTGLTYGDLRRLLSAFRPPKGESYEADGE
jgi:hypothetical protein